jgi:hypothetical protein
MTSILDVYAVLDEKTFVGIMVSGQNREGIETRQLSSHMLPNQNPLAIE